MFNVFSILQERFTDPWLVTVKLEIKLLSRQRWRDQDLKSFLSAEPRRDFNIRRESSTLIQIKERLDQTPVLVSQRHEQLADMAKFYLIDDGLSDIQEVEEALGADLFSQLRSAYHQLNG